MAGYRTQPGHGGEWHIYPDGRRVFVRKPAGNLDAFGKGIADLQARGLGYDAQTGQRFVSERRLPASAAPSAAAAPQDAPLVDDAAATVARAQDLFQRGQQLGELDTQGRYDKEDVAEALRRMAGQRPKDQQNTREGANQQGLYYSGTLGKRLDDLAVDYARREADQQRDFQRREEARKAARAAIESGAPLEDAAISAALAERRVAGDTTAADAGGLVPEQMPKAAPPAAPAAPRVPSVRRPAMPRQQRPVQPTAWPTSLRRGPSWYQRRRTVRPTSR